MKWEEVGAHWIRAGFTSNTVISLNHRGQRSHSHISPLSVQKLLLLLLFCFYLLFASVTLQHSCVVLLTSLQIVMVPQQTSAENNKRRKLKVHNNKYNETNVKCSFHRSMCRHTLWCWRRHWRRHRCRRTSEFCVLSGCRSTVGFIWRTGSSPSGKVWGREN